MLKSSENTGSKDEQRETTENFVFSPETNPLKILVILDHLFNIVDYQTLKVCRVISIKWKEVSDPVFIERSVFTFENKTKNKIPRAMLISPVEMKQLFGSMERTVNFTAFKFRHALLTGPVNEMYFEPYKNKMTQLEIAGAKGAPRTTDGNNFDKWVAPHLKKLIVSSVYWQNRVFALSLETLAGISHINLKGGELIGSLSGEVKLSPKELILRHIYLQNSLEFVRVADFDDFCNLQVLHLDFVYSQDQKPYLNFSYCANIKTLILIGMKINLDGLISPRVLELRENSYYLNGQETTNDSPCVINDYILEGTHLDKMILLRYPWNSMENNVIFDFGYPISVDQLTISGTRFQKTEKNVGEIKIKNLTIRDPVNTNYDENIGMHGIDIRCLPSSLESLIIGFEEHEFPIFSSSGDICLPKLRQLILSRCNGQRTDGKGRNAFALFSKCPLLVDVSLFGFRGVLFSGNDEDHAFSALKRLALRGVAQMTLDNTNLIPKLVHLDVLILPSKSICSGSAFLFEAFANFRAKLVVILFKKQINEKTVTRLIRMKQTMHLENIAFGPVKWETDESFRKSLMFPIVNTKAEYYLLEGDGGKTIGKEQLLEM